MSDVWFNRSVAEAVSTVTAKNLVFLVYIYDDSEQSKQLENTLLKDNVASVLREETVALKMEKDSENAKMFAQLYPISQVPVVYFILQVLQGTIKDFGIHDLTGEDIINKVNVLSPNNSNQQQVKDKLEEIKKKREEEEKQKAKEREMKRREDGKMAQETRENLKEQQNKLYLEKKRKEKKEEEEYKRKIKEQIAKDRENQIAARKAEKEKKALEKQPSNNNDINASRSTSFYDHSNLNIKQLDGSSLRHNFSSSDTLAIVSQWIDSARTDGDMPYKLFAQFPNRNFDIGDEQRTLLELKLCPSATLIMKPIKNATSAYGASNSTVTSGWLNYLYSASDVVYNSVTSAASYLITPTNAPEPGQRLGGPSNSSSSTNDNNKPKSNINTLRDNTHKKSDDDRQTYNGNSVNQE